MEPVKSVSGRKAFAFVEPRREKCKEKPKPAGVGGGSGVVEAFSRNSAESVARQANGSTKRHFAQSGQRSDARS